MTDTAERTYTTIDKTAWPRGPWDDEPDKAQWVDEATGLDCLLVRNRLGALCGYVGVPPVHPWHGQDYGAKVVEPADDGDPRGGEIDSIIDVHGGLTYANACQEDEAESEGICHVPAPGRPADVWWFGFDCGHYRDFAPGYAIRFDIGGTYRDLDYVRGEIASLAAQLARVSS